MFFFFQTKGIVNRILIVSIVINIICSIIIFQIKKYIIFWIRAKESFAIVRSAILLERLKVHKTTARLC